MTNNFKLLAIRPLKDCDKKFLKNLKAGEIYKLYNDFEFSLDIENNDVISIKNNSTIPDNLFGEKISVSAIVGKNGSGKSTIIELFSSLIFNLSVKLDLINIINFKKTHELSIEDIKRIDNEILYFNKFNCEIYYIIENSIYSISKKGKFIFLNIYEKLTDSLVHELVVEKSFDISKKMSEEEKIKFLRQSFFYSVGANYSLFGLNTNESGLWLKSLFHKNDGYQTPIVLNPMRTDGKIDINKLTYLSKSRLLFNVFRKLDNEQDEENSLRNLVNGKIVNKLKLNLDFDKFKVIDSLRAKKDIDFNYVIYINDKSIYLEYTKKLKSKYFNLLIKSFFGEIDPIYHEASNINKLTIEYILRKTETIIRRYPEFEFYSRRIFRTDVKEETIKDCFKILSENYSHSTYKLRQALNFLKHNLYKFDNNIKKDFFLSTTKKNGIADIVNKEINLNRNVQENIILHSYAKQPDIYDVDFNLEINHKKHNLINYLPPSFFEIDFEFNDKGFFKDLSSGEKQMVFSINSIIYHLINLKSIDSEKRISYNNFNIFLDEIELYFHPEFQRKYLFELLKAINNMRFDFNGINILFLTHSPFILSDIPSQNILKLEEGAVKSNETSENTFGANIHDLLAKDFFLKDGFIGEFAKQKIEDIIFQLNLLELIVKRNALKDDINYTEIEKIEKEKIYLEEIESFKTNTSFEKFTNNEIELKINKEKRNIEQIIKLIGEPVYKYKLKSMFDNVFISDKKELKIAEIKRLLENNGLTKDDLDL